MRLASNPCHLSRHPCKHFEYPRSHSSLLTFPNFPKYELRFRSHNLSFPSSQPTNPSLAYARPRQAAEPFSRIPCRRQTNFLVVEGQSIEVVLVRSHRSRGRCRSFVLRVPHTSQRRAVASIDKLRLQAIMQAFKQHQSRLVAHPQQDGMVKDFTNRCS